MNRGEARAFLSLSVFSLLLLHPLRTQFLVASLATLSCLHCTLVIILHLICRPEATPLVAHAATDGRIDIGAAEALPTRLLPSLRHSLLPLPLPTKGL